MKNPIPEEMEEAARLLHFPHCRYVAGDLRDDDGGLRTLVFSSPGEIDFAYWTNYLNATESVESARQKMLKSAHDSLRRAVDRVAQIEKAIALLETKPKVG